MRYFIIAGEASGDLHGSLLMESIKKKDPKAEFMFWGGDLMEKVSANLVQHFKEIAFMGFADVIKNLGTIRKKLKLCKSQIADFKPDVIILIDYPGFNLRIAKWAKNKSYKVFYYISPKVWAWKKSRVEQLRNYVDRLFIILPFEKEFFESKNVEVSYYGHPLCDIISRYIQNNPAIPKNKIALLPGSRKLEIQRILPVFLEVAKMNPQEKFIIGVAPSMPLEIYSKILGLNNDQFELHTDGMYSLLIQSKAALVTSGTATLETALFNVPQVVCYKADKIFVAIAKRIVTIKYISLVNLIVDKSIVTELIQEDCSAEKINTELNKIKSSSGREQMLKGYSELLQTLKMDNSQLVTDRVATEMIQRLEN